MKKLHLFIVALILIVASTATVFAKSKESPDETRAKLDEMSTQVLERMYEKYPETKKAVKMVYGYSTISGASVKYGFWGDDHGRGVAINNETGKKVYVKLKDVSVGLNVGAKEFDLLFLITNEDAWNKFVYGNIRFGADVHADASDGVNGKAFTDASMVADGVYVYQIDKKGLALELSFKGMRVSPFRTLN